MIIKGKEAESLDSVRHDKDNANDEPPPQYTPPPPGLRQPEAESSDLHVDTPPAGFPAPSNYAIVHRTNSAIRDRFSIDPLLIMPEFLLPPLEPTEEIRPNLKLKTTNASINADVYVYGSQIVNSPSRPRKEPPPVDAKKWPHTVIVGLTTNAQITLTIRECPSHTRAPLDIALSSSCASITLYLPRSFHGPLITTTSYAKTVYSQEVQNNSTTFLEVDGSRTSFIGEYSDWMSNEGRNWLGDTARLTTTFAKIKVAYTDETDTCASSGGFTATLSKIFGF